MQMVGQEDEGRELDSVALLGAGSGRRRKYYRITSGGRAQLAEERRQWQTVDATLRGIWSAALPRRA
jgi:DNA-binding PadR family transcriptional regulator